MTKTNRPRPEYEDLGVDGVRARIAIGDVTWEQRFRSERAARTAVAKRLALHDNPQLGRITLHDFFDEWMADYVAHECTPLTAKDYETCFSHLVEPHLGNRMVGSISPAVVDAFISELCRDGGCPTVIRGRRTLSAMLSVAESWGYIAENPVSARRR